MNPTLKAKSLYGSLLIAMLLSLPVFTHAADRTWTGNSLTTDNWSDTANWDGLLGVGDNLIFSGGNRTANINDIAGASFGWLRFDATGFSLSGQSLILTNGLTNTLAAFGATVGMNLVLGNSQTFVSEGGTLTFNGSITKGGSGLTIDGSGDTTWPMNVALGIKGAGDLIKNGAGTLTYTGGWTTDGRNFGVSGGTIVNSGTLNLDVATWGNNSVLGTSLIVNPSAIVNVSVPHILGASGYPISIYGGTFNQTGGDGIYATTVILSNATITAANSDLRGSGNITNLASSLPTSFGWALGSTRIVHVENGAAEPDIDFTGITTGDANRPAQMTSLGAITLTKTGPGKMMISGPANHTGPTLINAGTMALNFGGSMSRASSITVASNAVFDVSLPGNFSLGTNQTLSGLGTVLGAVGDLNPGATISPGGNGVAGTLTIDTLNLNGNVSFVYDMTTNNLAVGGGTNDLLIVTNLTLSPSLTNLAAVVGLPALKFGVPYTLIKYVNGPTTPGVITTLASPPSRSIYTFANDTVNSAITVTVTANPFNMVWRGDGLVNAWDIATTPNWRINGVTQDSYYDGDYATFNDTGSNTPAINITTTVRPSAVTVAGTKSYTFGGAGKISGGTSLTNTSTGTLTFNNVNDYSGPTVINAGTVDLRVGGAIASPGIVNNGGTMTVNVADGSRAATNTVNNGGLLVLNGNNAGSGSAQGTININSGGTTRLTVGNALGYSGTPWVRTVNINGGLMESLLGGNNVDNGWGITVNMTGGELRANGGVPAAGGGYYSMGGGSAINTLANPTPAVISGRINTREGNTGGLLPITVADGTADPDLLISAAITSTAADRGIAKNGPGTLWLTGPSTYNSPTAINAGVVRVGDGGVMGQLGTGVVTNHASLVFNRSDALTVAGAIHGSGTVQQIGAGALLLNGASTYTNTTTVSAGTLQGTGSLVSPVTVQSGAKLSAGGVLATGTLTLSNAVLDPGAELVFDLASTAATSDLLNLRGSLALNSTPIRFNLLGGVPFTSGTYTLLTNASRTGTHTFINPSRYAITDLSDANSIKVSFTGSPVGLVWKGNINNLWNVNTTANWLNGAAADTFYQADTVLFNDTGAAQPSLSLATTVSPASMTVDGTTSYTLSGGAINTMGALTKNGSSTLTLATDAVFGGGAFVNAGTLQIGNGGTSGSFTGNIVNQGVVAFNRAGSSTYAGVVSGPGVITASGGGTLLITGAQAHTGGASVAPGTTVQLGNGAIVDVGSFGNGPVTNNGTVVFYRAGGFGVAAPHSGPGAMVFQGTGGIEQSSYTMNGTNTFTGPVTLSLARLQAANAASYGNASSITVNQGSGLYVAVATNFNIPLTLSGTGWLENAGFLGALRLNSGGTWNGPITLAGNTRITAYNNGNNNQITGTITGGSFELEIGAPGGGSSLLTLAPPTPNTFGTLRLSPGTLVLGNANALPSSATPLILNGGTLRLNGNNYAPSTFSQLAAGNFQNGSTNSIASLTLTYAPNSVLTASGFSDGPAGSRPLDVTFNQSGPSAAIAMTANNTTWTGNFTNNGGLITIGATTGNAYLGANGATSTGRNIVGNNGSVFLTAINNTLNGYRGNVVLNNSTWICNRYISMAPFAGYLYLANSTMTGTNGGDGEYKTWQLPSTVRIGGTAPSYMIGTGTGLAYDVQPTANGGTTFDVADATGNANSDLIVGGGTSTAYLHAPANTTTGGSMTKIGAGTMELNTINTYTGPTTVSAGTLKLGAGASLPSDVITVASGATLDASALGTWTLGAQTLRGGGTVLGTVADGAGTVISPGTSAGTLTVGGLSLNGSGSLAIELSNLTITGAGINDLIQINGNLSLTDGTPTPVTFAFLNGSPAAGTYTIMTYTGSLINGSAAGLTNTQGYPVTFTVGGGVVQATFAAYTPKSLVWAGGDTIWDQTLTSTNWLSGSVLTNFMDADTVAFDSSTLNTTVSINATVRPASILVDSTNDYTFTGTGKISGSTGLAKNNTNTLTLSTANDFIGPVNVNQGTLRSGNAAALPNGAVVNVASGGAFDYAGNANVTTREYTFNIAGSGPDGSGALNNTGGGIFGNASIATLNLTGNATINGANRWDIGTGTAGYKLDGGGYNLTKLGAMVMSIRPEIITNLASLTVSNGGVYYENFDQTNAWTANSTNILKPGTSLGNYAGRTINMPLVLDGATIRHEGGTGIPVWTGPVRVESGSLFQNNNQQMFYGPISGPGAIWVNGGAAALTFTNASTFSGGTVVSNGLISVNGSGAAGSATLLLSHKDALGTGPVSFNGTSITNNTITNTWRAVEFNVTGGGLVPNSIVLPTSLITNISLQGRDNTTILTLGGKITGGHSSLTNILDFGNAGSLGVFRLSNPANDFVAPRIRVNRGYLAITAGSVLGNAANNLVLDQASTTTGLRIDAPGVNVSHNVTVLSASGVNLFGDNNGDGVQETVNNATLGGIVSGAGGTFNIRGTNGVLTLTGANTYSGSWELLEPAVLQVASSANLGTAALAIKAGTFRYTGTGSETMTRNLWHDNAALQPATIDITSSTAALTWNPGGGTWNQPLIKTGPGALALGIGASGSASVTVNGGTLTLTGNSTHPGPNVVNAGRLFVNGAIGGGATTVSGAGSVLGGNGTINGPVTVGAGVALKPGAAGDGVTGALKVRNSLTLDPASTTTLEINMASAPTCDSVTGMVSLMHGGTLVVNNLGTQSSLVPGTKFTLFGSLIRMGTFNGGITLPALDAGRAWVNNIYVDGTIEVISTVNPTPAPITYTYSGGTLTLEWPADRTGWRLQSQTNNLSTGITTTWYDVPGSTTTNKVVMPVSPSNPTVFYRMVFP